MKGTVRYSALLCLRGHHRVVPLFLQAGLVKGMVRSANQVGHHRVVPLFLQAGSVRGTVARIRMRVWT